MLGRTDRRLRHLLLITLFGTFAVLLVGRLGYWQLDQGAVLRVRAKAQIEMSVNEPSQRGRILDRRGTVLATTTYRDTLSAYPKQIPAAAVTEQVQRLAGILGLNEAGIQRVATALADRSSEYVVLARELTGSQSDSISTGLDTGELRALQLEPQPVRLYPNPGGAPGSSLASQLLGFVDRQGTGRYGIEERYQTLLAGTPRVVTALRDPSGHAVGGTEVVRDQGVDGADLRLTIDASLQLQVEKELYAAWVADRATRVSAVVLDPDTGEVLAWASVPGYDANDYAAVAKESPDRFIDPIASDMYEPGSVMKMFTAAAAYGSGTVTRATPIRDTPSLRLARSTIHNSDRRGRGTIPFEDVIAYSRNVGTARVAAMLGPDVRRAASVLYDTWNRFGIGQKTGVDVSNEVAGLAADPARTRWESIDLANRSFGQGVAATPIQLATAFGTMVNGGTRVQPHLLGAVDGQPTEPAPRVQVIDASLSTALRQLMTHVVTAVPWYREGTHIPGYLVGGKTGTAQIWDTQAKRWAHNIYNFSFAGFVGQQVPQAIVVTRIHDAQPQVLGVGDFKLGITSYELFRRIAVDTMVALDIPPLESPPTTASAGRP